MRYESPSELTDHVTMSDGKGSATQYEDYRMLGEHGRMCFGTVRGHGRLWFVKSLSPQCRDITECQRSLIKEYEILISLHHRGIVRAVALAEIEGAGLGIIMEYVEGEHLDRYAAHATRRQRRQVADELMDAMAYMHSRGFTHLDLKPENILVRGTVASPQVCIIDFNLSDGAAFDVDKERGGNRRYSAPEQFEAGYVASPTADVWSLGKLLKELKPGVSWKGVIRRALKKEPERRPADASAMIALERRWRRALAWCIFLVFLVLAGIAAFFVLRPSSGNGGTPEAVSESHSAPVEKSVDELLPDTLPEPSVQNVETVKEETVTPPVVPADNEMQFWEERYESHVRRVKQMVEDALYRLTHLATAASLTAAERWDNCVWAWVDIDMTLNSLLRSFRAQCPEQVLEAHALEWGSDEDPIYANDVERLRDFYKHVESELRAAQEAGR